MECVHPDDLVAAVRGDPHGTLIALDFDGTLAPIVSDPSDSAPVAGTLRALRRLAGKGVRLAVITGRDAGTVVALSGFHDVPGLLVDGLYGAESWRDGALETLDTPEVIHALRDELPEVVRRHALDPAVWIEDKRLSLVVHGRLAADAERALDPLRSPVAELAQRLGLEFHPGSGVLELRLPGYDKGAALRRLVERLRPRVVVFAGDDLGDLPAFAAVRELRAGGLPAWGIGIGTNSAVAAAADMALDDPAAMVGLLQRLAE